MLEQFLSSEIVKEINENKHLISFEIYKVFNVEFLRNGFGRVRLTNSENGEIGSLYRKSSEKIPGEFISDTNQLSKDKYYWEWEIEH